MRKYWNSLKVRIAVAGVVMILLGVCIVAVFASVSARDAMLGEIDKNLLTQAEDTASSVDRYLGSRVQDIQTLSRDPALAPTADIDKNAVLKNFKDGYGETYENIVLVDPSGRMTASASSGSSNYSDQTWFKEASSKQSVYYEYRKNPDTGKYNFIVANPVKDSSGALAGVLCGTVSFTELNNELNQIAADFQKQGIQSSYAFILDKTGVFVWHAKAEKIGVENVTQRTDELGAATKVMISGQKGNSPYTYEGVAKRMGYVPMSGYGAYKGLGWSLGVTIEQESLLAPISQMENKIIATTLVTIILAMILLALLVSRSLKPLGSLSEYLRRISQGDIPVPITDKYTGEFQEIKENLNTCISTVNALIEDTNSLTVAAIDGRLDTRTDTSRHQGAFRQIVEGFNSTLDAVIGPLNVAAEYIDRIARGETPPRITQEYKGDFNEIKNNLNMCIDAISNLVDQMGTAINAAQNGRLDGRADAETARGVYRKILRGLNETLDAVVDPLKVTISYMDAIARGDIPPEITAEYKGDFKIFKENLNTCIRAINQLVEDSTMISQAAIEGRLDARADATRHQGDFRSVVQGINDTLDAVIGPLNVSAEYIDRIAVGDNPDPITEEYRGDFNEIKNNLNLLLTNLAKRGKSVNELIDAAVGGRLDFRADTSSFTGSHKTAIDNVNVLIDAMVAPLNVAAEYIDRIAKGDIPPSITDEYRGDFNETKNNINQLIDNLKGRGEAVDKLIDAAVNGRLDYRADTSQFIGSHKVAIDSVNDLIDAMVAPLNVAAEYIDRIAQGDNPEPIADEYRGDFNEIKNNINLMLNNLGKRARAVNELIEAAVGGRLDFRADTSSFTGSHKTAIDNVNKLIDAMVAPLNVAAEYIDRIAKGDIPSPITDEYKGDFNEIKNNINTCIAAINLLVSDASDLARSAVEGRLDARADISRHYGDYRSIVKGVNETLDAVIEPIRESAEVLQALSEGRLDIQVSGMYRGDHATLKNSVNSTIESLNEYIGEISSVLKEMSMGNLNVAITGTYKGDFIELKDSLNAIIGAFNEILDEINRAADQVSSGAGQVAGSSQALSQAATEQASAIEEITASVAEIAGQTKENALNANRANDFAIVASKQASQGNQHMNDMLNAMTEVNEAAHNISRIIKVIDEIAFQTNILALNAAVEAARAGEHGKGFAVVAEEVRNLAARSANAARETTDMIEGTIKTVDTGSNIARSTAVALEEIVHGVGQATELVGEIAAASNQQATGVAQIDMGIGQIAQIISMNSATSEETAAASQQLAGQAEVLKDKVGDFKLKKAGMYGLGPERLHMIQPGNTQLKHDREEEARLRAAKKIRKVSIAMDDDIEFGKY